MSLFEIISWFLIAIFILVSIHEYGHFAVARLCGVKVLRFSIGFGKRVLTFSDKKGTEFALSAIPLGGYVKMLDEREGEVAEEDLPYTYNRQPVWRRIAILAAGPVANFLLAFFLYSTIFIKGTTQLLPVIDYVDSGSVAERAGLEVGQEIVAVDGQTVGSAADVMTQLIGRLGETGSLVFTVTYPDSSLNYDIRVDIDDWLKGTHAPNPLDNLGFAFYRPTPTTTISTVETDSAADKAGLQVGDNLLRADGKTMSSWDDWVALFKTSPNQAIDIDVLRDGGEVAVALVPELRTVDGKSYGFAGLAPQFQAVPDSRLSVQNYGLLGSLALGVDKVGSDIGLVMLSLKKLIVGEISTKNLSGPIGIAKVAASEAQYGLFAFIGFLAYLSVVLGVMNLLPVPMLDGGHIMYCLVEWVAGKPVPEKVQLLGLQAGLVMLAGVMALAFYNDIVRW